MIFKLLAEVARETATASYAGAMQGLAFILFYFAFHGILHPLSSMSMTNMLYFLQNQRQAVHSVLKCTGLPYAG